MTIKWIKIKIKIFILPLCKTMDCDGGGGDAGGGGFRKRRKRRIIR